jgi:ribosomal protein S18 acetylase RimI-like enzyme
MIDRTAYELVFDEDFTGAELDPRRWVAHYLPQWTTPERSAARYELAPGVLRLRIEADQPAWRLEDGELRVSNLQTGTFSGPAGSAIGQHRHRDDLVVETAQAERRLYTPSEGLVEAVLRAGPDPTCMLAFWLVGFERSPEQSGEICVAELFGNAVGPRRSGVRIGVKAHHDPRLREDMDELSLELDASDWHAYAAEWDAEAVRFFVDDELVRTVEQRIDYPLQLMVDLFEFPEGASRDPGAYPKIGEVAAVRGYQRAARIEVLPPSDPRAERALVAFMTEMSSRWLGRPAAEDDVGEALREFPSDGLQPPGGLLLVAHRGDAVLGCAGLRFIDDELGEVNRVYVAPEARRRGLGRRLMAEIERLARERGLRELRLDTRSDLVESRGLYERIGYREVPRFGENPYAAHWFAKRLSEAPHR